MWEPLKRSEWLPCWDDLSNSGVRTPSQRRRSERSVIVAWVGDLVTGRWRCRCSCRTQQSLERIVLFRHQSVPHLKCNHVILGLPQGVRPAWLRKISVVSFAIVRREIKKHDVNRNLNYFGAFSFFLIYFLYDNMRWTQNLVHNFIILYYKFAVCHRVSAAIKLISLFPLLLKELSISFCFSIVPQSTPTRPPPPRICQETIC